jgi:hypothetical protein
VDGAAAIGPPKVQDPIAAAKEPYRLR